MKFKKGDIVIRTVELGSVGWFKRGRIFKIVEIINSYVKEDYEGNKITHNQESIRHCTEEEKEKYLGYANENWIEL